jgi:hypothetical protein
VAAVAAAAAVAAVAAAVAGVAAAAEVVELAGDTEAAVCRGELAASARPDHTPTLRLFVMAGFDKVDPANACLACGAVHCVQAGANARTDATPFHSPNNEEQNSTASTTRICRRPR